MRVSKWWLVWCLLSTPLVAKEASLAEIKSSHERLVALSLQLDFATVLQDLEPLKTARVAQLQDLHAQLLHLDSEDEREALTQCDRIQVDEMRFQTELALERHGLVAAQPDVRYPGQFYTMDNGPRWYRHWLKSWLGEDVALDTLIEIAHGELEDAKRRRAQLRTLPALPQGAQFKASQHSAIVAAFRQRERVVTARLGEVMGASFEASRVNIIKSTLPKSFPAPGIYDNRSGAFIYHLQSDVLPQYVMDWLFLHEALPGHHYQFEFAQRARACDERTAPVALVFSEGWGAYVETLGTELGLYTDRDSLSYALDWQALRAVRVLLDVGIHARGWRREKARQIWMQHIPEQADIMAREIERIHNWPAQVITYVYGKARIQQAIAHGLSQGKTLAQLHHTLLAYAHLPPAPPAAQWAARQ